MEKDFIYEIKPEVADLNENSMLKPYAYQDLFAKIAERHLDKIDLSISTTTKYNMAWALISLSFEICKPVKGRIKILAQTWHSVKKGPYYRRELLFKDENGDVLFKGSTFSVLLNLSTRAVYRKKDPPFPIGLPLGDVLIEAAPSIKLDSNFSEVEKRKVYNSHIDCLGHVNNIRYGEFAYDTLSPEEKKRLSEMKRYDIFFKNEMKCGEEFSIQRADEDGNIIIKGVNTQTDQTSFEIIMKL